MFKKTILVLFALVFTCLFASAVSISAPSSLPAYVNWSFSVQLDSSDSFDKAIVSFGSKEILSVFSNGQIVKDPYNGQFALTAFTIDSDPSSSSGLTLYVSLIGFEPSSRDIKVDTFDDSNLKGSETYSVNFFVPIDESRFNPAIDSLTNTSNSLKERITSVEGSVNEFSSKASSVEELKNSVSQAQSNFQEFMDETTSKFSTQATELLTLKRAAGIGVMEEPSNEQVESEPIETSLQEPEVVSSSGFSIPTALAGLSSRFSWMHVFLVLVVAAAAVGFFVMRKKQGNNGGTVEINDRLYQESQMEADEKGKWSVD